MSKDVAGIPLKSLEDPIYHTLGIYSHLTGDQLSFDQAAAAQLEHTPDKPNSARSQTSVFHKEEYVGNLFVIAFKPGDGTGDENTYPLSLLDTGEYPRISRVSPRSKETAHSEVHLSLVAARIDHSNADPILFAGNLMLLGRAPEMGRDGKYHVVKLGELGQPADHFDKVIRGEWTGGTTTFTVGYDERRERFGDPHAVYNPKEGIHSELVQVCGFIALSPEKAEHHASIFQQLGAVEPQL